MRDDLLEEDDCAGTPAMPDPVQAAQHAQRRDMTNVSIRIATLRMLDGTWPGNRTRCDAALWHYATRAIAGDY